ncbi:MAG: NAD(P)H-dependent oxidoreductase [Candidatus Magasanikbacteria bacterium]|nr:NAD(P)H-dependent oxidoreductase [Candidatus Magasanikbacteria bacterium]
MKVLTICGSLRAGSYNRKLLKIAASVAENLGAQVQNADLKVLNLPIYDQDIEDVGMPENVMEFKSMVEQSDIILFVSPEYNHSVSGALKNAIDWLSRGKKSLDQKTAAIMGASDGAFGTVRGQAHLREILGALSVRLIPSPELFVRFADKAFDEQGKFIDPKTQEVLERLMKKTFELYDKLK